MAPKVFDDSKSGVNAPPSYDTISVSASAESVQFRRPFIFSFLPIKQKRNTVLSCIRDIVLAPNFAPSSAVPTVNACAAALSAAQFSDLLQTSNIEGHTALYWAILNLRNSDAKAEVLRRSLSCPPNEVQVHETGELGDQQFVVSFRIGLFQKRLRIAQELNYGFVAGCALSISRFVANVDMMTPFP
ncbi:hypothetical protein DFH29DRAFT_1000666 [Suillus ampliporus]|nr:hypothetical protein DFH29DRAFT_1000666 [Suillus ampliporus]